MVGTAVVPAAMEELRPYLRRGVRRALTAAIAAGVGLTLVFSVTLLPPKAYAVEYRGRSFPIESRATASAAERALRLADRIAPRDGRLFVGPADLRRTVYADAYMYFLLHRLRPATFFIVLDPGVTELRRHRLARELLNADVLILNRAYDHPTEPNRSRVLGTGAPNRVVDRAFCERGHFGTFLVYARCRHSS